MSGPRPLRAPSKRDASKLPTSTRGAYLLDAAAAVPGTAPVFASLLARRAAQVSSQVVPRSAQPLLCPHCGGPLVPTLARIVRLSRSHRRRQQAQQASKPAGARQAHSVALVTPCSLCDVEHVRRFRTLAAARQASPQAKDLTIGARGGAAKRAGPRSAPTAAHGGRWAQGGALVARGQPGPEAGSSSLTPAAADGPGVRALAGGEKPGLPAQAAAHGPGVPAPAAAERPGLPAPAAAGGTGSPAPAALEIPGLPALSIVWEPVLPMPAAVEGPGAHGAPGAPCGAQAATPAAPTACITAATCSRPEAAVTPASAAPPEAAGAKGNPASGRPEQPATGPAPAVETHALPEAAAVHGGFGDVRPEPPEAGLPPMIKETALGAMPSPAAAGPASLLGERRAAPPAAMPAAVDVQAPDAEPATAVTVWEGVLGGSPEQHAAAKRGTTGAARPGLAAHGHEPGSALALRPPAAAEHGVHQDAPGEAEYGEVQLLARQQPAAAQRAANGPVPWAAMVRGVALLAPEQPAAAQTDAGGAAPKAAPLEAAHARGPSEPGRPAAPERPPAALGGAAGAQPPAGPEVVDTGPAATGAHQQADAAASPPASLPGTLAQPGPERREAEARGAPSTGVPGELGRVGVESAGVALRAGTEPQGVPMGSGTAPGGAEDAPGGDVARAHFASQESAAPAHEAAPGAVPSSVGEDLIASVASGEPALVQGSCTRAGLPMPRVHGGSAQAAAGGAAAGARSLPHERARRTPACDVQAGAALSGGAAGAHIVQQGCERRSHAACAVPVPSEAAACPQGSSREPAGRAQAADTLAGSLAAPSGSGETLEHPAAGGEAHAQACSAAPEDTAGRTYDAARREVPGRKRKALGWVRVGRGWHPQRAWRSAGVVDL